MMYLNIRNSILLSFLFSTFFVNGQSDCNFTLGLFFAQEYDVTAPCLTDGRLEIRPNGGTAPYTYQWSNGDRTQIADSLAHGVLYAVTVTDANGCVVTEENLQVPLRPGPPQPYVNMVTNGPEIFFEAPAFGYEDIAVSYEWILDGEVMPFKKASFTLLFEAAGEHKIRVNITDICGTIYRSTEFFVFVWISPEEAFTFDIGSLEGVVGDTISLPVTTQNFKNIIGFQKSIHLLDETTGKITGFSNFNLTNLSADNFEKRADNLWNLVWFNQNPVNLPDSTVLYNIEVVLTDSEAACTKITFDSEDIPLQIAVIDGTSTPISIQYPWIRAAETCVATTADLGGQITTVEGLPIPDVTIITSILPDLLTDETGQFILSKLPLNDPVTIQLNKEKTDKNNLTILDLILIQHHILNRETLDGPYKLTAADVNRDRTISIVDLVTLQQFILEKIPSLPSGNWIFLPKDFQLNELQTNVPEEFSIPNLENDRLDFDFIGIQMGNVSGEE